MSIELSIELENQIADAVRSGRFTTPTELIETAGRRLLDEPAPEEGRFRKLRRRIEESGVPLLTEDELQAEVQSRRGRWA